jgi:hypothetical protein
MIERAIRPEHGRASSVPARAGRSLRRVALIAALTLPLGHCDGPSGAVVAGPANFSDRFAMPQDDFEDRFLSAESDSDSDSDDAAGPAPPAGPAPIKRIVTTTERFPSRVAVQTAAFAQPSRRTRDDATALVRLQSSAFPYSGNTPRSDERFLNIADGARRGHRSPSGRVHWQDETYNDDRVLMHVPRRFNIDRPGVIVVYFHGNGATLSRDVRDRQALPQQISDSGANAVLLAPQLAVDAADSSAGKFWQAGALQRFLTEAAAHLARLAGDPQAAATFAAMPVVIVAHSGGYVPAAYSLAVGGAGARIRGVLLLDAAYGELDKFAGWIAANREAFFVSSYTSHSQRYDEELMRMLRARGIDYAEDIARPLAPGSVIFVQTPPNVTHRDYVTQAWTQNPVQAVLAKMTPVPARIAATEGVGR